MTERKELSGEHNGLLLLEKRLFVSDAYLIIPIQNDGPEGQLSLRVNDEVIFQYNTNLASTIDTVDWYAFFSLECFRGMQAEITGLNVTEEGFDLIRQSNSIPSKNDLYVEKYRPQFHFTSRTGWLNDPNGLIYYQGEYHLFYQHNPTGLSWGNMTWGHAISHDLIRWRELPKVLFPNPETGTCFSGATFIDSKNQLRKKAGDEDVLVAFYLRTEVGLCLAYSNDRGRTFTDYELNPVLNHEGARIDTPRPFWHEPTKRWVAPTYDFFINSSGEKRRCVGFYSSSNLTEWRFESRVEQDGWGDELCGCVDFFELPVDQNPHNKKWVMILIDGSYIVGDFDGTTFYTLDGKPATTDDRISSLVVQGDYYGTMTWHNMPRDRRVQIAWMRNYETYPGMAFNQQMTVPSELTLHSTNCGPRLRMNPIRELEGLRKETHQWTDFNLSENDDLLRNIQANLLDLEIEFEPLKASTILFLIRGAQVSYDAQDQTLSACGVSAKLFPIEGLINLRILLDRTSIEIYGNDGRVYIPKVIFPEAKDSAINLKSAEGEIKITYLRIHHLGSSWEDSPTTNDRQYSL